MEKLKSYIKSHDGHMIPFGIFLSVGSGLVVGIFGIVLSFINVLANK